MGKGNKQNSGFTLVELIISCAVLAIIAAPILAGFVSASKSNAQAKILQNATFWSQNLSEDFKARSIEELRNNYTLITDESTINESTEGYTVNADGVYTFYVQSPTTITQKMQAKLTLDPTGYDTVNEFEMPKLQDIDSQKNAVIMDELYQYDSEAFNEINAVVNSTGSITAQDMKKNITRKTNIIITFDNTKSKPYKVTVSVSYQYISGTNQSYTAVYERSFTSLPALYLFYTAYNDKDQLIVDNQIPYSVIQANGKQKVYIAVQKTGGVDKLEAATITCKDANGVASLESLQVGSATSDCTEFMTHLIATNVGSDTLIETQTKTKLYRMTIKILYKSKEISKVTATKED